MSNNSYNPFERGKTPSRPKKGIGILIPIELIKAGVLARLTYKQHLHEEFSVKFVDRNSWGQFLTRENYTQRWGGREPDGVSTFENPLPKSEMGLSIAYKYGEKELTVVTKEEVPNQKVAELFVRWGAAVQAELGISDVNFEVQFVPDEYRIVDVLEVPPLANVREVTQKIISLQGESIKKHIKTYALWGFAVRHGRFGLVIPVAFSAPCNLMMLGEASLDYLENPYGLVARLAAEAAEVKEGES